MCRVVKVKAPSTCGQLETVVTTTIPALQMATPPASTHSLWDLQTMMEGRHSTMKTVPQRWPSPSVTTPGHFLAATQTGILTIKWWVVLELLARCMCIRRWCARSGGFLPDSSTSPALDIELMPRSAINFYTSFTQLKVPLVTSPPKTKLQDETLTCT